MKRLQTFFCLIFTAAFASIGSGQVPLENPVPLNSAASGTLRNGLAPELIASFNSYGLTVLAPGTAAATGGELPTELLGVRVEITDGAKITRRAPLFFVSPTRIDFLVPLATSAGRARLRIFNDEKFVGDQQVLVNSAEAGIFTANGTGEGATAGTVLRVKANGEHVYEALSTFDAAQNKFVPVPIDLGDANEQVYLILYGTGMRQLIDQPFRPSFFFGGATIGGEKAGLNYFGPQGSPGLEQINVAVPRSLAGKGEVDLQITVSGRTTNIVKAAFK